MPEMSENPTQAGEGELSHATRREERSPGREAGGPGGAPPGRPRAGALFRALLQAGCDMEAAYTAAEEAKRMAGENVATENVVTLTHLADGMGTLLANVDKLAERVVSQGERLDGLADRVDRLADRVEQQGERLDALSDKVDRLAERVEQQSEKLDALSDKVDRLAERVEQQGEKLDALSEKVDRHGEILTDQGTRLEVLTVRMDGLQREMRLMWGALGALVTVLGLVFTLLFSR